MDIILFLPILGLVILILIAIFYDKIMSYISFSKESMFSEIFQSKGLPRWEIKPFQFLLSIFFLCMGTYSFFESPHFKNWGPGLLIPDKYGAPVHNYAFGLLGLFLGIYLLRGSFKRIGGSQKKNDVNTE